LRSFLIYTWASPALLEILQLVAIAASRSILCPRSTKSSLYVEGKWASDRMHRAEQVRQILATRSLTLYRLSRESGQIFGRYSRFFVPHNLYYDMADSCLIPTIH